MVSMDVSQEMFRLFNPDSEPSDEALNIVSAIKWDDPKIFLERIGAGTAGRVSYPKSFPSAEEVRSASKPRVESIWKHWVELRAILERHEEVIRKRWMKKTKEPRRKILLAAWPGPSMPTTHRPDTSAVFKETDEQVKAGTRFRDSYLWPYINQEDLCQKTTMPLFLNARGRNPPSAFAFADIEAANFGFVTGAIVPDFLVGYTMMFFGANSPDNYGELVSFTDHPEAFSWWVSGRGILPGKGLILLEIQDRIYRFLVKCCQMILSDLGPENLLSEDFQIRAEPPFVLERGLNCASLSAIAAEAPYRVPANLDFTRLRSLLFAKRSAAEDHVWALREDPTYFVDTVGNHKEHRQELILDADGQTHFVVRERRGKLFWNGVIEEIISCPTTLLEMWSNLYDQATRLESLQAKYASSISPNKSLSREYLQAILKFKFYIDKWFSVPVMLLAESYLASPPIRRFCIREDMPERPQGTSKIRLLPFSCKFKSGIPPDETLARLTGLLQCIWDTRMQAWSGVQVLVDEVERLLQNEPKAKEFVSPYNASTLGDISVLSECGRQIRIYQPWSSGFEHAMGGSYETIARAYIEDVSLHLLLPVIDGTDISTFGVPEHGRFY